MDPEQSQPLALTMTDDPAEFQIVPTGPVGQGDVLSNTPSGNQPAPGATTGDTSGNTAGGSTGDASGGKSDDKPPVCINSNDPVEVKAKTSPIIFTF